MGRGLKRFEVEGFRQFKKPSGINVSGLNVIVGPNGSGKSTFTRLMRLMDEVVRKGLTARVPFSIIDSYGLSGKGGRTFKIKLYYSEDDFFPSDYCIQLQYRINNRLEWKLIKSQLRVKSGGRYVTFRKGSSEDGFFPIFDRTITRSVLKNLNFGDKDVGIVSEDAYTNFADWSNAPEKREKEFLTSTYKKMLNEMCLFLLCKNSGVPCRVKLKALNNRPDRAKITLYPVILQETFAPTLNQNFIRRIFSLSTEESLEYERYRSRCVGVQECFALAWVIKSKKHWGKTLGHYLEDVIYAQDRIGELTSGIIEGILAFTEVGRVTFAGTRDPENGIQFTSRMFPTGPDEDGEPQTVLFWKSEDLDNITLYKDGQNQWKQLLYSLITANESFSNYDLRVKKIEAFLEGTKLSYNVRLNNNSLGVDLNINKNGKRRRLGDLSKGEVRVVALSLLKFYGCNFLEEPENSLHPKYQSLVGTRLAEEIGGVNNVWLNYDFGDEASPFSVVETHSEYLIRSIQLSVAAHYKKYKNSDKVFLPEGTINDQGWMLAQDTEIEFQPFSELNGITISYFNIEEDGTTTIKDMGLREDGMLSESFGPGFFDESVSLTTQLLQLHNNN